MTLMSALMWTLAARTAHANDDCGPSQPANSVISGLGSASGQPGTANVAATNVAATNVAAASVERGFCVLPESALEPRHDGEVPLCSSDGTSTVAPLPTVALSGSRLESDECRAEALGRAGNGSCFEQRAGSVTQPQPQERSQSESDSHHAAIETSVAAMPQRVALPRSVTAPARSWPPARGVTFGIFRPPRA